MSEPGKENPFEGLPFLGDLAKEWDAYIMAQAKATHPEFPDRFFNVGFAINPQGEIILKHYKLSTLYPVEHSVTPHDVWDRWIELYGSGLRANMPWWGGLDPRVWQRLDPWLDWILPTLLACAVALAGRAIELRRSTRP